MHNTTTIAFVAALTLTMPFAQPSAAAQSADAAPPLADTSVRPYVTVRLFAGPGINMMGDWRNGIDSLASMADGAGLSPHQRCCIGKSWGAAGLVHVTDRFAVGASVEALRDSRGFLVTDRLRGFGLDQDAEYSFTHHTEVQARQALVAFYPRSATHTHVQIGGGIATGHSELSTPGSSAYGRLHATMLSFSAGTERRFWYVDAGWRFLRMHPTDRTVSDFEMFEARDVFPDAAAVEKFVRERDTDLTGVWARVGVALHFGRR